MSDPSGSARISAEVPLGWYNRQTMTLKLSPIAQAKLELLAKRAGVAPSEYAARVIEESLQAGAGDADAGSQATLALLREWQRSWPSDEADRADAEAEAEEFMAGLNAARVQGEGSGARKVYP
jgi:hypothetical protein